MICYKDKTWCHYPKCKNFQTCPDALTDEVKAKAKAWWSSPSRDKKPVPICLCSCEPTCYGENIDANISSKT